MTVVELSLARDRRDGPDLEFVSTDECGQKMFTFGAEYSIDGSTFSFNFFAYDFSDAERRILAMKSGLSLSGKIYCEM